MQLLRRNSLTLYLKKGGATVEVDQHHNRWHLVALKTDPKERRKGHARRLVMTLVRAARRLNKRITLTAGPFNDRACDLPSLLKFYTSCGFKAKSDSLHCVPMEFVP